MTFEPTRQTLRASRNYGSLVFSRFVPIEFW